MLVSISYHTIDGEISSVAYEPYTRSVAMLTDALGSVVRTQDDYGGADFRYYAYGGLIKATPGYLTPCIGWVGSLGYRETNLNHAEQYIRARHYSTTEARWTTKDPIWPQQRKYTYLSGRASTYTDSSGLGGGDPCSAPGVGTCAGISVSTICSAAGDQIGKELLASILNSNKNLCQCALHFKGSLTVNIKSGCFSSSGLGDPFSGLCSLPPSSGICTNIDVNVSTSCSVACKKCPNGKCKTNPPLPPYHRTRPLPPTLSGSKFTVHVVISNLVGSFTLAGTITTSTCR